MNNIMTETSDGADACPSADLLTAKVGDDVAVFSRYGPPSIAQVEKTTPTQIIVRGKRYARRSGYEVGSGESRQRRPDGQKAMRTLSDYECKPKKAKTTAGIAWWYAGRGGIDIYVDIGPGSQTVYCRITKRQIRQYLAEMDKP